MQNSLLGVGLYSVSEAARLTKISPQRIRRWLRGYSLRLKDGVKIQAPVVKRAAPVGLGTVLLTFADLLEVRLVDAFLSKRVSLQTIRIAAEKAQREWGANHPFLSRRFKVSGRTLFLELIQGPYDFLRNQTYFREVIGPYLEDVDFDGHEARRWWPLGRGKKVVIDPSICLGKPIVAKHGIPTGVISMAVEADGSVDRVARWYGISSGAVKAAVDFELHFAA